MLVSQTESNLYFGKMLIGRIAAGRVSVGDKIKSLDAKGVVVETSKIHKIIRRFGMGQVYLITLIFNESYLIPNSLLAY